VSAGPPPHVLRAFDADGEPEPLPGGQGGAWRIGSLVLKLQDRSEEELAWQAEVLGGLRADGVRVAPPLPFAVDGWSAAAYVEGRHEPRRWADIVAAGEDLHAALAGVPWPRLLDRRTDRWAVADRVAFGELDLPVPDRLVERLLAARRPLALPSQLVHGDLTGNVLFADGLPPAVIDLAPYWRPPGFASAVVVADALVWEGAGPDVVDLLAPTGHAAQLLVRALLFRLVTDRLLRPEQPVEDGYLRAVALATARS
jgi:uncharacterized protein (TIGR02569 family)